MLKPVCHVNLQFRANTVEITHVVFYRYEALVAEGQSLSLSEFSRI